MRAAIAAFLTTAAFLAAPMANAAPPGTPHVTVGADTKQLIFDWDDAVGAGYYRLLYKVGSGAYKPLIDNIPAATTQVKLGVPVHLQSWSLIRYAVAACNTSGCTNSAAIFPQNLMLDSIGYFKASNTDAGDNFGNSLVLSDDGRTLAVNAEVERSSASGVNGNQADNSSPWSGAVYVFRRASTGWRQEAYLKAGVNHSDQYFGSAANLPGKAIAINANGSLLAIGTPLQEDPITFAPVGAVYIFQKSSSGNWSLAATLRSPSPEEGYQFGHSVELSLDGRTLKVNSRVSAGQGGFITNAHIFVWQGDTWQHSVTLAPFFAGDDCRIVRLSGDGNTLVSACQNVSTGATRLETRKRSGNTWTHVSDQPLNSQASNIGLALNVDATTMALQEIRAPQQAVGIYRWMGAAWIREAGFPASPASTTVGKYGLALELNRTGNMLAIGDAFALENGAGVSPKSMPGIEPRGAVYVWRRNDSNATWTLRSVIKSPNPGVGDYFGTSIAFCGTGNALAISAEAEDSKSKGVDGDRTDDSSTDSGAAYLY